MLYKHRFNSFTFKHMLNNTPVESNSILFEHYHTQYELFFLIRGNIRFALNGKQNEIKPQTLLLIKPGENHQSIVDPDTDYERIVINFSRKDVSSSLYDELADKPSAYDLSGTDLAQLFYRMDEMTGKYQNETLLHEMLKCNLTEILLLLCYQDNKVQEMEVIDQSLSNVLKFIDEHLVDIETEDDISRALFLSKSSIEKLFRQHIGVPIMTYVRHKKCIVARDLISSGAKPSKIYQTCGFKDYSTFYRIYTKCFAETPSDTMKASLTLSSSSSEE